MENIKELIMNNQSDTSEKKIFEALSKDVLNGLSIDLVSIWYFTNDNMNLTCQYSIDRFNKHNLTNIELLRSDFPNYFSSVIEDGSISAENVYSHPNTKELTETYFEPYNVKSLLDYIIYIGDVPVGLICCETTSNSRTWNSEDIDYVRALTVMAGVELKTAKKN